MTGLNYDYIGVVNEANTLIIDSKLIR